MIKIIIGVSIVNILIYLILAGLILRVWNYGKAQRRFFFLLLSSAGWFIILIFEALVRHNLHLYEFLGKVDFTLASLVAFFFLIFTIHFPNKIISCN